MKKLILAFSLLFILISTASSQIKQTYDKFKDVTSLSTVIGRFHPNNGASSWMIQAEYTGEKATNPKIYLMLLSVSDEWKFLKTDLTLRAIADNRKIIIGRMIRADSNITASGVNEILSLIISPKTLESLGNYSTLEVQVGQDEFSFDSSQIVKVKEFAIKLKSLMPVTQTVSKPSRRTRN